MTRTPLSALIASCMVAIAAPAIAAPALADTTTNDLAVTIGNVETPSGAMMIALFDSEASWKSNDPIRGERIDVTSAAFSMTFEDIPAGTYGIKIFHDVNGNGELDTGAMGIPTEPYAFSNDAPIRFGPPSWSNAAFDHSANPAGASHTVTLR